MEDALSHVDPDEWERLNAFVDGEMSEQDRQRLRERARIDPLFAVQVAGLRHLKSEIRSAGNGRKRHGAVAMAAAVILALAIVAGAFWASRSNERVAAAGTPAQILSRMASALDATEGEATTSSVARAVPALDLGGAGFRLASVSSSVLGAPLLVYEGLHGCRVVLTILSEANLPDGAVEESGVTARTWHADGRRLTLVTRGMDPERFRDLALALELMTRGGDNERVTLALKRSSQGRTCLG